MRPLTLDDQAKVAQLWVPTTLEWDGVKDLVIVIYLSYTVLAAFHLLGTVLLFYWYWLS